MMHCDRQGTPSPEKGSRPGGIGAIGHGRYTSEGCFVSLIKQGCFFISGPGIKFLLKLFLQKDFSLEKAILDWRNIYGDTFAVKLSFKGPHLIFILDFDKMKEIFLQQADFTSNRPYSMWLVNQLSNKNGKCNYIQFPALSSQVIHTGTYILTSFTGKRTSAALLFKIFCARHSHSCVVNIKK